MNPHDIPYRNYDFKLETMDDRDVLHHPGQPQAAYLNKTASLVLMLCDGQRSVDNIVSYLLECFPDAHDIESDVRQTLGRLETLGAIGFNADGGP